MKYFSYYWIFASGIQMKVRNSIKIISQNSFLTKNCEINNNVTSETISQQQLKMMNAKEKRKMKFLREAIRKFWKAVKRKENTSFARIFQHFFIFIAHSFIRANFRSMKYLLAACKLKQFVVLIPKRRFPLFTNRNAKFIHTHTQKHMP